MASAIGELAVFITADSTRFSRGVDQALVKAETFALRVAAMSGAAAAAFTGWGISLAAEAETAQAAFETMLGSSEAAAKMLADIKTFADRTPFGGAELRQAAQTMLAFGVSADSVMDNLRMLGDVAGTDANKLQQLALVFGQVSSIGKLMGGDLIQLSTKGFNPLQIMADQTGISVAELRKKMEAGQISFEHVRQALVAATSAGGAFFEGTLKQSVTLAGRWSTLKDEAASLALAVGEALMPAMKSLVDAGSEIVGWFKSLSIGTIETTAKIVGFTAAFAGAILLVPKIVAAFKMITAAYRALAAGQAIAMAFAGPKGLLALAVGAAAAAAAVISIDVAFDSLEAKATKAGGAAKKAADQVKQSFNFGETVDKAAEKAAKEAEKERLNVLKEGTRLTEQMRTPAEILADSFREVNGLLSAGVISMETYARAVEKMKEDYRGAVDSAKELSKTGGTAAVTRGTSAGFSAVESARRDMERSREIEKASLLEEKRINATLARIETEIKKPGTKLGRVDL